VNKATNKQSVVFDSGPGSMTLR